MTDQNNLARGYSSDVSEEDPLAGLARIVSGQEPVVRKPAVSPFQQPASGPTARSVATAPSAAAATIATAAAAPVRVEAPAFDLEDALMAELGFGEQPQPAEPEPLEPEFLEPETSESEKYVQAIEPEPVAEAAVQPVVLPLSLEDQLLAELS